MAQLNQGHKDDNSKAVEHYESELQKAIQSVHLDYQEKMRQMQASTEVAIAHMHGTHQFENFVRSQQINELAHKAGGTGHSSLPPPPRPCPTTVVVQALLTTVVVEVVTVVNSSSIGKDRQKRG